ncbi:hypothetical protein D3C78_759010 [compost metagenome]
MVTPSSFAAYTLNVRVSLYSISAPIVISVPSVNVVPFCGSLPSSVYLPLAAFLRCSVILSVSVLKEPPAGDAEIAGRFDSPICSIRIRPLVPAVNVATPPLTTASLPV